LTNYSFRVCRPGAGNIAEVVCLTALLVGAGCVGARAQVVGAGPAATAGTATLAGQASAAQAAVVESTASCAGTTAINPETISSSDGKTTSGDGQCEPAPQSVPDAPKPQGQTTPQGQTQGQNQTPQGQTTSQGQTTTPPQGQAQGQGSRQEARQPQTSRILDIIPNFRAVSTDEKLPAQTVKEKFIDTTEDSFDYSAIFIPLMLAGYSDATKATPEFGHGWPAYARYFWHTAVDQTSENYMVEFIVPAVTHEDTRYYTLGRGGFLKRAGYALSRAVITRNDKGKDEFNISEVVGAGASSGISSLYYPSKERSLGSVGTEWGLDVAIDALSFEVKEFWPDVNHALFHRGDSKGSQ
jgi:hypothetical protein